MPDYAKKIVYLSEAQYQELITNQTITVNGTTINYDENTIYMTPQNTPLYATDLADWAKAANKPTYTAQEVGALPANTVIPEVPVSDVQVNGNSVLNNGIANIDSVIIPGTGIGSAKTRDFEYNNSIYSQTASGIGAFAEGLSNLAMGSYSHAEGSYTVATNAGAHAEGRTRAAISNMSHAEGMGYSLYGTISRDANTTTYTVNDIDIKQIQVENVIYLIDFKKIAIISSVDRINNKITLDRTFENELNSTKVMIYQSYTFGRYSHAEGYNTTTLSNCAHAEGEESIAKAYNSHAEGTSSKALGNASHSEGTYTVAAGHYSHTENNHTFALGRNSHAENSGESLSIKITGDDNATIYSYIASSDPSVGDYITAYENYACITVVDTTNKQITVDNSLVYYLDNYETYVYRSGAFGENSHVEGIGTTANGNAQHVQGKYNVLDNNNTYADIVGNGATHTERSNAYVLTWTGDGKYAGDVYVKCNNDSTGGTKLATENIIAIQDTQPTNADTKIWLPETAETPVEVPTVAEMNAALSEKVGDVQIGGSSIVQNGVANVPVASANNFGVIKVSTGLAINSSGNLYVKTPTEEYIKEGSNNQTFITPFNQYKSVFYGLAKASGDTTQSASSNAIGTYTDEAKGAIRTMLGAGTYSKPGDGIPASDLASGVVPVQDVQINGTSVLSAQGVANIPLASSSAFGVVSVSSSDGLYVNASGQLSVASASLASIKSGPNGSNYRPITPYHQHESVFYGLANAAGDTTQNASSNAVGTYTDNAKASIKAMLGVQDGSTGTVDVSGTTPTITAVENTRYVCGEVTSLDFTPAASGICIVRFTSGSSVTVLTLPSTVKFPEWFDSTSLETNTIYEICITDGVYGAVMSWAQ